MRRRGGVQRRRVVFVGVEGKSDRAFVRFLGHVCDEEGLHLHLDVKPATGGDSLAVVDEAGRRLKRHPDPRAISRRLVLLDSDRIEADRAAGRDAWAAAAKWKLEVLLMTPNLEGVLVRLHRGRETRAIAASHAGRQLKALWPNYDKGSLRAEQLKRRFSVTDLRRVVRFDRGTAEVARSAWTSRCGRKGVKRSTRLIRPACPERTQPCKPMARPWRSVNPRIRRAIPAGHCRCEKCGLEFTLPKSAGAPAPARNPPNRPTLQESAQWPERTGTGGPTS